MTDLCVDRKFKSVQLVLSKPYLFNCQRHPHSHRIPPRQRCSQIQGLGLSDLLFILRARTGGSPQLNGRLPQYLGDRYTSDRT